MSAACELQLATDNYHGQRSNPRNDVDQRKQEDPHEVDKVPVEAAVLDPIGPSLAQRRPLQQHDREQHHADNHVQGVETGHEEVRGGEDVAVEDGVGVVNGGEGASELFVRSQLIQALLDLGHRQLVGGDV